MSEAKRKLRLLLWPDCNRRCPGCCNNDWDVANLPVCTDYSCYDEIMLTGGEPMLYPKKLYAAIHSIRKATKSAWSRTPIYVYTADVSELKMAQLMAVMSDGLTVTLHEQKDAADFIKFAQALDEHTVAHTGLSLRVNVFIGVVLDAETVPLYWTIKSGIKWIKDCPLPDGETFLRWDKQ